MPKVFDHRIIGREIARLLSIEVEKRGITRTAIAEKAGLPLSSVSDFLNGVRTTRAEKYAQIARAIGMSDLDFERLCTMAKRVAFKKEMGEEAPVEDGNQLEFALSQRFGDNTKAIEQVLRFADYVEETEKNT